MNLLKKLGLLTLIICLFSSCENEGVSSVDIQKINAVKNLKGDSQKIAFGMLSKENKFHIWNNKLNSLKNSNVLNSSQKEFVHQLIASLRVEYFEENAFENHAQYYNIYLPEMKRIGKLLFTQAQLISYFSSLDNIDDSVISQKLPGEGEIGGGGGGGTSNCNCSSSDDWCVWGSSCFVWSCERHIGCGWWLAEECNGLCVSN